jgi:hypothetical protein
VLFWNFFRESKSSHDEAHVRKRLGEISDQTARGDIVFFGEQTHVIAKSQYPLEQHARIIAPIE